MFAHLCDMSIMFLQTYNLQSQGNTLSMLQRSANEYTLEIHYGLFMLWTAYNLGIYCGLLVLWIA